MSERSQPKLLNHITSTSFGDSSKFPVAPVKIDINFDVERQAHEPTQGFKTSHKVVKKATLEEVIQQQEGDNPNVGNERSDQTSNPMLDYSNNISLFNPVSPNKMNSVNPVGATHEKVSPQDVPVHLHAASSFFHD